MIRRTDSGLWVCEDDPKPADPPKPKCYCSKCGKPNFDEAPQIFGRMSGDWERHTWTCEHVDIRCPDCRGGGCVTCGNNCEYT